jgi:hypothetical protein
MSVHRTLWRDRALVELNRAVLWSFENAGLRISDHHTESHRFIEHLAKEERAGRATPADWTWIVPPMSASTTPVFHRYYDQVEQKPNFYLDPEAAELARQGAPVPGWADVETVAVPVIARPRPPAERVPEQVCPFTGSGGRGGAVLPRPRVRPAVPPPTRHDAAGGARDTAASRWRWPFRQRPSTAASERSGR